MRIGFPTGRFVRLALHHATPIGGSLLLLRNVLPVLLACGMLAGTLHAQTIYTYSTTGGNEWTLPGNWTGGVSGHFPGDGNGTVANEGTTTDIAAFGAITNPAASLGIDFDALNGSLTLGAIQYLSSANRLLSIGNSSAAAGQTSATLAFTGQMINGIANTILSNEGSQGLTLQPPQHGGNSTFDMSIALASGTDNVIQVNGSGSIFITAAITGTGSNLILDGSGDGRLYFGGSTSNTYSGTTTIKSGTLDLKSDCDCDRWRHRHRGWFRTGPSQDVKHDEQ